MNSNKIIPIMGLLIILILAIGFASASDADLESVGEAANNLAVGEIIDDSNIHEDTNAGDILADEVAQISGAPWLFGSAELAMDGRGIYTPNQLHHPKGDQLTGKGVVSPYGILDAVSLLLRYSCKRSDLADLVHSAVSNAIHQRLFTAESLPEGGIAVTTEELGDFIAASLYRPVSG